MRIERPVLRLFPVLLLNLIGFAIAIPVLPALAQDLGGDAVDIGFLYAIQAFGQFVMAPLWGAVSDRIGRKRTLLLTFLAAAIFEFLSSVAMSLWFLYAMRLIVGMCAGNIATASAMIADATDEESRSQGMAVIGISFGIGFTIGAGLGGAISTLEQPGAGILGTGLPFAVAAGIYLLAALAGAFLLVEPAKGAEERRKNRVKVDLESILAQVRRRPVLVMCTISFFYTLSVTILESTFFVYADAVFDWREKEVGFVLAGMGFLMAIVQGGIGRISNLIGDRPMTGLGAGLLAVGLALAPSTETVWLLFVFLGIATVGRGLIHPGILSLTSGLSDDPSQTGKIMGVQQSFASLARIIGPALGGVVFQKIAHGAPFWLAGGLLAIAGVWWWWASRDA
ncbi:MAG: MFS transporter [Persicimonas sp.]